MDTLNNRKGILQSMENHSGNRLRLFYHIPARSLIGYYGQFLSDTRGSGILNKSFLGYEKHSGQVDFYIKSFFYTSNIFSFFVK